MTLPHTQITQVIWVFVLYYDLKNQKEDPSFLFWKGHTLKPNQFDRSAESEWGPHSILAHTSGAEMEWVPHSLLAERSNGFGSTVAKAGAYILSKLILPVT